MAGGDAARARRERWFDAGAAALRSVVALPEEAPAEAVYACPLCLVLATRDGVRTGLLTEEHVPPRYAGGRGLVLTCAACNHAAGSGMDSHAERYDAVVAVLAGGPGRPVRATVTVGGVAQNVSLGRGDDGFRILGIERANAPTVAAEIGARLEASPTELTVSFRERFEPRRASLSWLRAAYLAAFAAFGYRYVLSPPLALVRQQLADPATPLMRPVVLRDMSAPRERRDLLVVTRPTEERGVAVAMGERVVFLPWIDDDGSYFDRAHARHPDADAVVDVHGKRVPWPNGAQHALDQGYR